MAGAPLGNQNATKQQRQFGEALQRAIKQDDGKRLRGAAEKLLDLADSGEAWAVRELADRLDGKPAQSVQLDATVTKSRAVDLTDDELAAIVNAGDNRA